MQRGLRQIGRRRGCLANDDLDLAWARGGLRFDARLTVSNQDQQAPLSPCIFYGDSYQLFDQPGKNHLTRNCLRCFDYGLNVELSQLAGQSWPQMRTVAPRAAADIVRRVALLFRARPNGRSSCARCVDEQ